MTTTPPTAAPIGRSELLGELYRIARRLMPVEASASEETTDACGASARLLAIADGWRDEDAALHAEMRRAAGWPVGILRFDALADHTTERAAAMVAELCTAREAIDDWRNATAAETPHDARERRKDMESAIGQERERIASLESDLAVATGNAESRATHAAATVRARRESEGRLHERIAGLEARERTILADLDEAVAIARRHLPASADWKHERAALDRIHGTTVAAP